MTPKELWLRARQQRLDALEFQIDSLNQLLEEAYTAIMRVEEEVYEEAAKDARYQALRACRDIN